MLDYDPDTGIFIWKIRVSNVKAGDVAGASDGDGYIMIRLDNKLHKAHRLAWLYVHGVMPDDEIDHINRVRSDNRIVNLRLATRRQNGQNLSAHRDGTSKYVGVSWVASRSKWLAQIYVDGRAKNLGRFDTEEEARDAYLAAKALLHPFAMEI